MDPTLHEDGQFCYRAYGVDFLSNVRFQTKLAAGDGKPSFTFLYIDGDWDIDKEPHGFRRVYQSPFRTDANRSDYIIYQSVSGYLLRFTDVADVYVSTEQVTVYLADERYRDSLETLFLGIVFSAWLELHGTITLHASAVRFGDGAAGFIGASHAGKSTTAAALVQHGGMLITDDVLPIRFAQGRCVVDPAYSQIRLWPEHADLFLGESEHLERVGPWTLKRRVAVEEDGLGRFSTGPTNLAGLFLLSREAEDDPETPEHVEISEVGKAEALLELIRNSFVPNTVQAFGIQLDRIRRMRRMLEQVPVKRIRYRSGERHLEAVVRSVLEGIEVPIAR